MLWIGMTRLRLQQNYWYELRMSIPLGHNFACPAILKHENEVTGGNHERVER